MKKSFAVLLLLVLSGTGCADVPVSNQGPVLPTPPVIVSSPVISESAPTPILNPVIVPVQKPVVIPTTKPVVVPKLVPVPVIVPTPIPIIIPEPVPVPVVIPAPAPIQYCCKVCSKGKACGNGCISRNYTCHQPPGCACDG